MTAAVRYCPETPGGDTYQPRLPFCSTPPLPSTAARVPRPHGAHGQTLAASFAMNVVGRRSEEERPWGPRRSRGIQAVSPEAVVLHGQAGQVAEALGADLDR